MIPNYIMALLWVEKLTTFLAPNTQRPKLMTAPGCGYLKEKYQGKNEVNLANLNPKLGQQKQSCAVQTQALIS